MLCTDDQTFNIRQVQSSNSVFLIKSMPCDHVSESQSCHVPAVQVVSQCMAILELVPATHDTISLLTQALELYKDSPDVSTLEIELEGGSMLPEKSNRQPVLESVPFSLGEFDEAWLEICAFEHDGHAFRPSSTFLAKVWKSMIAAATTLDIDIARGFRLTHLLEAMNDDGFPRNLIKAIMARTGLKNEGKMEDCMPIEGLFYKSD